MSRCLADALAKLLAAGGEIVSSQLTTAQRRALEEFARRTQSVRLTSSGRGSRYQIVSREQVEAHLAQQRPRQEDALPADLPNRALNVARYRDSKGGGAGHAVQYLLLKAISDDLRWHGGQGEVLELSALTRLSGVAALKVRERDGWHTGEPLWLAAQPRAPQVILFPDYDGIGLQNFARLREWLGDGCSFWLMPGWVELLHRYGNRKIWLDNRANFEDALRRLQGQGMTSELVGLCSAMQYTGLALGQESVFLRKMPVG